MNYSTKYRNMMIILIFKLLLETLEIYMEKLITSLKIVYHTILYLQLECNVLI